jgi:hypothetical protein
MARAAGPRRRRTDRADAVVSRYPALVALLLLAAATGPASAGEPTVPHKAPGDSLLFSAEAIALIEAARRAGRSPTTASPVATGAAPVAAPGAIHLSAIIYHAPDDWRIWLNGQSFTPAAAPAAIEILAVTAGSVRLAWRGDPAGQPKRFELQPNQSYLLASGRIVEGRPPARRTAPTAVGASH